jgi:DNA-binding LytR/AlgR family response regulator
MRGETGFDLIPSLATATQIVFVTAHPSYAVRAFEVDAADYLLKPVRAERLAEALARVARKEPPRQLADHERIALSVTGGVRQVRLGDIVCILARDDYTELVAAGGISSLTSVTMTRWEQRLPADRFARVHRGAIVRIDAIRELLRERGGWTVRLAGWPEALRVGRSRLAGLRRAMDSQCARPPDGAHS